jgi:hypothetical protein
LSLLVLVYPIFQPFTISCLTGRDGLAVDFGLENFKTFWRQELSAQERVVDHRFFLAFQLPLSLGLAVLVGRTAAVPFSAPFLCPMFL